MPADCTAQAAPPVLVGEPHAMRTVIPDFHADDVVSGWPEALAAQPGVTQLEHLQRAYLAAYARFEAATGAADRMAVGEEAAVRAEPEYQAAHRYMHEVLESVASYKPHDLAEMQAKYAFLARKECYPLHDRAEFIMELVQEDALFLQRVRMTVAPRPRPGLTILPPDAEHDGLAALRDLEAKLRAASEAWAAADGTDEAAWDAATLAHSDVLDEISDFAPATVTELAAKLELLKSPAADGFLDDLTKSTNDGGLLDDILRLAPVHAPTPDEEARSRWLTAIRRHDEAISARKAAEAVYADLYAQASTLYPEPDPIMCRRNGEFRVFTRDMMNHRPSFLKAKAEFPPLALAQLERAVDSYEAACSQIDDEVGLPGARARADQADELESEMRYELMRTPAPDAEAFALKLMLIQTYRSDGQLNDTDDLQEMMVSDNPGTWATVELYKDMMRAAGLHTPAFDLTPFDAAAWIACIEARGWHVDKYGTVYWYDPEKTLAQGPHFPVEGRGAYDALKPYQQQAVRNEAARRSDPHRPTSVICKVRMACTILDDEAVREAELALAVARSGGASDEQMQMIRADLDRFGWAAKFPGMA